MPARLGRLLSGRHASPWTLRAASHPVLLRTIASLWALGSLLASPAAVAQHPPSTPIVRIEPRGFTKTSPGSLLTVTVYWCGDQYGFRPDDRKIKFRGVDLTNEFTWEFWSYGGCVYAMKSVGTIDLAPEGGQFVAEINSGWCCGIPPNGADVEYFYFSPPVRGIAVVASGQYVEAPAGAPTQRVFSVANTGAERDAVQLTSVCTGQTGTCTTSPSGILALDPGASADVTITYPVSPVIGTRGTATLKAASLSSTIADSAWTEITAVAVPPAGVRLARISDLVERDLCVTIAVTGGAVQCGELVTSHSLPAVRTMSRAWAPALVYASGLAAPRPAIATDVSLPAGPTDSVTATLVVNGGQRARGRWSGWTDALPRRLGLSYDASADPTGVYAYTVEVRRWSGGGSTIAGTLAGNLVLVNRSQSYFGAGWWLGGLEQLFVMPGTNDRLWIAGDGSARIYRPAGAPNVWLATSLDRPDTLTWDAAAQRYRRHLANGGGTEFDGAGLHVASVPRVGHPTHFEYDGAGRVRRLRLPSPAGGATSADSTVQYTFAYDADGLTSASVVSFAFGGLHRTLTATKVGRRITRITDPDNTYVGFEYADASAPNRLTARADRRGTKTWYSYEMSRAISQVRTPFTSADTVVVGMTDAGVRGLRDGMTGAGTDPARSLDSVYTLVDSPRRDVIDLTRFWINGYGTPIRVRSALGAETRVTFGDPQWPVLATESRSASGLTSTAIYDPTRGLLTSSTAQNPFGDGRNATTTYKWHPTWRSVTRVTRPMGDFDTLSYDAGGNLDWSQPGADPSRRTSYRYNGLGQVTRVFSPLLPAGVGDSIAYDAVLGNVERTLTPKGHATTTRQDAFGRVMFTRSPIDSTGRADSVKNQYDLAGRLWRSMTYAPVNDAGTIDSVGVEHFFDNEGATRGTDRLYYRPGLGWQRIPTSWVYDTLGRLTSYATAEGGTETYTYDMAGNRLTTVTARGDTLKSEHDALNRVTRTTAPRITYAGTWCYLGGSPCYYRMPTRGTQVIIAADTSLFVYDHAGNMVRADNRYARVRRAYTPSGVLARDTIFLRTYYTAAGEDDEGIALGPEGPIQFPPCWYPCGGGGGGDPEDPPNQQSIPIGGEPEPVGDNEQPATGRGSDGGRRGKKRGGSSGGGSVSAFSVPVGGITAEDSRRVGVDSDFERHVFTLRYHYDLNGRRDTLYHPLELPPCYGSPTCAVKQAYSYNSVTGALQTVTDRLGYSHSFIYDAAGRLTTTTSPGWSVTRDYDADDHLIAYGNVPLTNDVRGRVLRADLGLGREVLNVYSGLGPLRRVSGHSPTLTAEEFDSDPLGTRTWSRKLGELTPHDNGVRWHESAWGRVIRVVSDWQAGCTGTPSYVYEELFSYDAAGNQNFARGCEFSEAWSAIQHWETRQYYGPDQKLRVLNRHAGIDSVSASTTADKRAVYEEYRYDALGRRVLVRSRRDADCPYSESIGTGDHCVQYLERTVWDGDQRLYELRARGSDSVAIYDAHSNELEQHTQIVGYAHATGIDAPVSVIKGGLGVVPHANWRGVYEAGNLLDGRQLPCTGCPTIRWPGQSESVDGAALPSPVNAEWWGNLIDGGADGSGLKYMRNRYYDPSNARFTQKDPIGLAGGLNLYGFADGDPVNYSDPFGLCPPKTMAEVLMCTGQLLEPAQRPLEIAGMIAVAPLAGGMGMAGGISAEVLALGNTLRSGAGSGILTAGGVAHRVADAVGGTVSQLAKSEGFKVTVEAGKNIVARIKATGEMRVGIDRIGSLTREGLVSSDRALTHLRNLTSKELIELVNKAKQLVGAAK